MSRISSAADWLLKLPLIWGALACLSFYTLLGALDNAFLNRYFGRPSEGDLGNIILLAITAMFFVGCTALAMRLAGLAGQLGVMHRRLIDPKTPGGQSVDESELLLAQLEQQPSYLQNTYMIRRLRHALEQVRRKQSADTLEEDLRRLEEADYQRMAAGYGITKIIVWAIPILGFLGTVIGITIAIGKLSPEELEKSLDAVTAGLGIAFDTTAAALALSLVLTFLMFFVKGREELLLTEVDDRAIDELVGRFQHYGGANDPTTGVVKQMCEHVIRAVETATARQVDLWAEAISETHTQWSSVTAATTDTLKKSLTEGLQKGLADHATGLTKGVESQLATLNNSVRDQVDTLTTKLHELSIAYSTNLNQQTNAFTGALAQRIDTLGGDTENLMGNLRQGLERMAELLVEALRSHGETLTRAEEELATENRRHLSEVEAALGEAMVLSADRQEKLVASSETLLKEMQHALVDVAGATVEHQQQLVRQGEVLLKVVESTSQIRQLEATLNSNLDSLSRSHNFEETLLSLSAAIQLLVARVGGPQSVSLKSNTKSQAA
ncbi:MAG: MotA/TolQ/ExbB proton channel family protein [Planctomycetales bacterium]|nr:MotA/TolQ/ExbB proton channel family protein [Planctomycetales bacterium]